MGIIATARAGWGKLHRVGLGLAIRRSMPSPALAVNVSRSGGPAARMPVAAHGAILVAAAPIRSQHG